MRTNDVAVALYISNQKYIGVALFYVLMSFHAYAQTDQQYKPRRILPLIDIDSQASHITIAQNIDTQKRSSLEQYEPDVHHRVTIKSKSSEFNHDILEKPNIYNKLKNEIIIQNIAGEWELS